MASITTLTTYELITEGTATMLTTDFAAASGGYLGTKTINIDALAAQGPTFVNPSKPGFPTPAPAFSVKAPKIDVIHQYNQTSGNIVLTLYDTLPYTTYTGNLSSPGISLNSYFRMINSNDTISNVSTFTFRIYYFTTSNSAGDLSSSYYDQTFQYKIWRPLF